MSQHSHGQPLAPLPQPGGKTLSRIPCGQPLSQRPTALHFPMSPTSCGPWTTLLAFDEGLQRCHGWEAIPLVVRGNIGLPGREGPAVRSPLPIPVAGLSFRLPSPGRRQKGTVKATACRPDFHSQTRYKHRTGRRPPLPRLEVICADRV